MKQKNAIFYILTIYPALLHSSFTPDLANNGFHRSSFMDSKLETVLRHEQRHVQPIRSPAKPVLSGCTALGQLALLIPSGRRREREGHGQHLLWT